MSISRPKVQAPTPSTQPAAEGAQELRLRTSSTEATRGAGAVGRLRLRTNNSAGSKSSV